MTPDTKMLVVLFALAICSALAGADKRSATLATQNRFPTTSIADKGPLLFHSAPDAHWRFGGVLGQRIDANIDNWLLRAPTANPGMIEMFRVRDRTPTPNLVPWAGEFVGKYLISAIQTLRMTDNPVLKKQV